MTVQYTNHFSTRQTPQSVPMPGSRQCPNSAGGHSFGIDDWKRLDRFLVLGVEGGSYYAGERELTLQNAEAVRRCIEADGHRAVSRIVEISHTGRAPKNDPAIFALAMAAGMGMPATRAEALAALPRVCRTGTHLFQFASGVEAFRGWGRALKRAVGEWYTSKKPDELAFQLCKYQQRNGWSHRDLLRLCHVKTEGPLNGAIRWAVGKGSPDESDGVSSPYAPILGLEAVKRAATREEVVRLIREYGLPRECVPTRWLTYAEVWEALLQKMPLQAMVRNLATMTRAGLLQTGSEAVNRVVQALGDQEYIARSRLHPIALLAALRTYANGQGARGRNAWTPVQKVVDALDAAFYLAFANAEPTGKRWMLALDVSGSMTWGEIAGVPGLTPRDASAALALVTAANEANHHIVGFTGQGFPIANSMSGIEQLPISPRKRLDDAIQVINNLPMGPTDCALPMLHAIERKIAVDVFVVYTDSETWHGNIHPVQALRRYRERTGIAAKLIVVGMVSTGFSIADPEDPGMLDVVGFDLAVPQLMGQFAVGTS